MLVLTRKLNESLIIGDQIRVTVVDVRGGRVRIGIEAPPHISILRQEISDALSCEPVGPGKPAEPPQRVLQRAH